MKKFMLGTQGWQKIIDDGTTAVDDRVPGDEIEATPRYSLHVINRIAEHFLRSTSLRPLKDHPFAIKL